MRRRARARPNGLQMAIIMRLIDGNGAQYKWKCGRWLSEFWWAGPRSTIPLVANIAAAVPVRASEVKGQLIVLQAGMAAPAPDRARPLPGTSTLALCALYKQNMHRQGNVNKTNCSIAREKKGRRKNRQKSVLANPSTGAFVGRLLADRLKTNQAKWKSHLNQKTICI